MIWPVELLLHLLESFIPSCSLMLAIISVLIFFIIDVNICCIAGSFIWSLICSCIPKDEAGKLDELVPLMPLFLLTAKFPRVSVGFAPAPGLDPSVFKVEAV